MEKTDWAADVKGMLKGELKRRNVSYQELARRLEEVGVKESSANIANKISRGGFSAVFLVQCMRVIGCQQIRLNDG